MEINMELFTSILKYIVLILNMEATEQRIQFNIVIASNVVWSPL